MLLDSLVSTSDNETLLLLSPSALSKFLKLLCNAASADVEVVLVPDVAVVVVSLSLLSVVPLSLLADVLVAALVLALEASCEIRLSRSASKRPPPAPPGGGGRLPDAASALALLLESVLSTDKVALVAVSLLAPDVPELCACRAAMSDCIKLLNAELTSVEDVLEVLSAEVASVLSELSSMPSAASAFLSASTNPPPLGGGDGISPKPTVALVLVPLTLLVPEMENRLLLDTLLMLMDYSPDLKM